MSSPTHSEASSASTVSSDSFPDSDFFEYHPFSADYVPQNPCGDGSSSPACGSPIGYCELTGVTVYASTVSSDSFLDSDLFEYQPFSADYVPQNPCGDGISSPGYGSPIGYCSLTGMPAYATAR